MTEKVTLRGNGKLRIRVGLVVVIVGLLLFLLGADPTMFRLDRSPKIGMIQIFVFLCGLALICMGGYFSLAMLWNGYQKTIAADIGLRLVSTGFVIAVASGMADAFGFGSQPRPQIPSFGDWQVAGVIIGEVVIALGFLLLIPFWKWKPD
jgi:hypothetical protein